MEAPDLKKTIEEQDWEKTSRILQEHPHLAKQQLSEDEFEILWHDAPLETIRALLKAWPEAYEMEDDTCINFIDVKLDEQGWDFLDVLFLECPQALERYHASIAAMNGASLDFLIKHWNEAGTLLHPIHKRDWEETSRILRNYPELAKEELSKYEYDVLWEDAPLETIQVLLEAWPEAYQQRDSHNALIYGKIHGQQWEFLKSIIPSFSNIVTVDDVRWACYEDAPVDVLKLMLEQQPNAPVRKPEIIFELIEHNKLEHVRAVLDRCPAATGLKDGDVHLTPLLYIFQKKEKINTAWIGLILEANPHAAKETDFDGKTALHLAYQHGASSELIHMIQQAYPDAENERDNLGQLPKDLEHKSEKTVLTPANETLILQDKLSAEKKSYPDDAVVVCRGDMLIREPKLAQNEEDKKTYLDYSEQVHVRRSIFETLLDEFSKMVGIDDKDVIQKAAAVQALAVQYLSNKNDTIINFDMSDNPGYWYQQEVLKLVMRVYHEGQIELENSYPSVWKDAKLCIEHLNDRENGEPSPEPSDEHVWAYTDLTTWLTEGLDKSSYSEQGPVLKPIQSLFNKLFIRRGQTSVHVIGDMVRGTLLVDDVKSLQDIVKKIKTTFPNITENQFRHPDKCTGLADFLSYVHNDLKYLPGSGNNIIPYRFKANSSQKKKEKPLCFNLNFFLQVPEHHRVGFSEMFVACELQIGLTEEINKHRSVHDAYERDRILSNQPLLKNYDSMTKEEGNADRIIHSSNCTEDDNQMIEKVLFGKIASEVLIPSMTEGNENQNNLLLFREGRFTLSEDAIEAGTFVKPERLCVNNRSLNWYAMDCPKRNDHGNICVAFKVAGPYNLDETKRYFVGSCVIKNPGFLSFYGSVGLYAHVGPYLVQIACGDVPYHTESRDIVMVESGRNLSYLEQMCPVPAETTALEVIVYGSFKEFRHGEYDELKLSLKVFDVC